MHKDPFKSLENTSIPPHSIKAKEHAIQAALSAFDQVQEEKTKKFQGIANEQRPISIINRIKWIWNMPTYRTIGPIAAGLVIIPAALFFTTNLTTFSLFSGQNADDGIIGSAPQGLDSQIAQADGKQHIIKPAQEMAAVVAETEPSRGYAPKTETASVPQSAPVAALVRPRSSVKTAKRMSIAPPPGMTVMHDMSQIAPALADDQFSEFKDNGVHRTSSEPVSTFSTDVDTASYSFVRRMLLNGNKPEKNMVRVEEMINYFPYAYSAPLSSDRAFEPTISVFPTPWNANTQLLHIGLKGYIPPAIEKAPSNLVFLIDTSGSMNAPDKLPLLKKAFSLLLDQLGAEDTISIVTYAGSAGLALEPTSADQKRKILAALENLNAGGSTAGQAGIQQAYDVAISIKKEGQNSRIILATDGDFNVGISDPAQLKEFIADKRKSGVSLSVLGFGAGNYDDRVMQSLAQAGNGNASYIDSYREAQKVLVNEIGATLKTIASDVKIQIEFNPARISEYRLIGYETRALRREDFNNDKVDAGDLGAGHTVTAIYELTPVGSTSPYTDPLRYGKTGPATGADLSGEIGHFKLRYKRPGETESQLISQSITDEQVFDSMSAVSTDVRFATAVAAFGQKLRNSIYLKNYGYSDIRKEALASKGKDQNGYRAEFIGLIDLANSLSK